MLHDQRGFWRYKDSAAMREILRAACLAAGSQKAWAKLHGVSLAYVNDVLKGRREAGDKIVEPLGFEIVRLYQRSSGPR